MFDPQIDLVLHGLAPLLQEFGALSLLFRFTPLFLHAYFHTLPLLLKLNVSEPLAAIIQYLVDRLPVCWSVHQINDDVVVAAAIVEVVSDITKSCLVEKLPFDVLAIGIVLCVDHDVHDHDQQPCVLALLSEPLPLQRLAGKVKLLHVQ